MLGNATLADLVGQTFATILQMLYTRSIEKEIGDKMCMSVDGPQTLVTLDFLEAALLLGPESMSTELFCYLLEAAAGIKLSDSPNAQCGSILPGKKLAGKHFDRMSDKHKAEFMVQVRKICAQNDASGWRRMKVVLKALCGGKKKASGFNQRPSLTDWDCDRINRL